MSSLFEENFDDEAVIGQLAQKFEKPPWEVRDYKLLREVQTREEWEALKQEASEQVEGSNFLDYVFSWQEAKAATDVAKIVALRRRLARELNATTIIELMFVDLLAANYQMQCDWLELMGSRTHILHRTYPNHKGDPKGSAVEHVWFGELAEKIVPILDRLNRQFIRTTKAYRDLKSSPITVNIGQAGQVNVGGEQMNVVKREE